MLEYLDDVYYNGCVPYKAFLINSFDGGIDGKHIYIMGSGVESFLAYNLLKDRTTILGFVDNNLRVVGERSLDGGTYNAVEAVYGKDACIVIATSRKYLNNNRWKLLLHNVDKYSMFFGNNCINFEDDDMDLLVKSVNKSVFSSVMEKNFPPMNNVSIRTQAFLEPFVYMLTSTLYWGGIYKHIKRKQFKNLLEIGPGRGILSWMVNKSCKVEELAWQVYSKDEADKLEDQEYYNIYNDIKKDKKIELIAGITEDPKFDIDKKYDCIIMTEVMEHFTTNPVTVLKKIGTWMHENSLLCVSTPNWGALHIYESYKELPEYSEIVDTKFEAYHPGHTYQFSKQEMDEIFEEAGFKVVSYELTETKNHSYIVKLKN